MNEIQAKVFQQIGALVVAGIEQTVQLEKQQAEIERLKALLQPAHPPSPETQG